MSQSNQSAYMFIRDTRSTRLGAYDDSQLFSIRQEKEIAPHRERYSRTGNHGEKIWFLLDGEYYLYTVSISNSGKGGPALLRLTIQDGEEYTQPVHDPPDWLKDQLGEENIEELFPTPYS